MTSTRDVTPAIRVVDNPAVAAASSIARRVRSAVRRNGVANVAVSGGSSAPPIFAALAALDVPWDVVSVWQVDERVAPDGDADRNASQLAALGGTHHPMPVTAVDLGAAADEYAASLPHRFDVIHLGMGDDGHTASWPPGDPVIDSSGDVAVSGLYQGRERMTLTPQVVNRAVGRVVVLSGAAKAPALAAWVDESGQPPIFSTLPIARVRRSQTVVFADKAAAAMVGTS